MRKKVVLLALSVFAVISVFTFTNLWSYDGQIGPSNKAWKLNNPDLDPVIFKKYQKNIQSLININKPTCANGYQTFLQKEGWCSGESEFICVTGGAIPASCPPGIVQADSFFGLATEYTCWRANFPFLPGEVGCANGFKLTGSLSDALEIKMGDRAFGPQTIYYQYHCEQINKATVPPKDACIESDFTGEGEGQSACCD